eukprot:1036499_1
MDSHEACDNNDDDDDDDNTVNQSIFNYATVSDDDCIENHCNCYDRYRVRNLNSNDMVNIAGIAHFFGCLIVDNEVFASLSRSMVITTCSIADCKLSDHELYQCLQQKHSVKHKMIMNIGISYWLYQVIKFINSNSKQLRMRRTPKMIKLLLVLFGLMYVLLMRLMSKGGRFWSHLSFWNEIPTMILLFDLFLKRRSWIAPKNNKVHLIFVILFIYVRCVKVTKLIITFSKQLWMAQNEGRLNDDINDGYKYSFICGLPVTLCIGYWLSYKLFVKEFHSITITKLQTLAQSIFY